MKLKLNFKDRLMLLSLFSTKDKAPMSDWGVIDECLALLNVSSEERDLYGVTNEEGATKWSNKEEADKENEYTIPKRGIEIAEDSLKAMNSGGGIHRDYVPIAKMLLE